MLGKHIPKLYINKIICMGTWWRGYVFPSWLPWWGAMGLSLSLFFPKLRLTSFSWKVEKIITLLPKKH
jgi:hypothetical protein